MDRIDVMLEPLRALLIQIGEFLPRLAVAIVVLIVGLLVAKAARFAVQKGLRAINFQIVTQRAGLDNFLQQGHDISSSPSLAKAPSASRIGVRDTPMRCASRVLKYA